MGKVYHKTYYHIIWSTYNRAPTINRKKMELIRNAIYKKCTELNCRIYALDGWKDHIHLLTTIPPKLAISTVVKNFKGYSSRIINLHFGTNGLFRWQRGYSVFTVSENRVNYVIKYILSQEKHHSNIKMRR